MKTIFPHSYTTVFNNFRGGYQSPYWRSSSTIQSNEQVLGSEVFSRYKPVLSFQRLSNTPVLQSSAKNLLVNQAAFQKVFRARFDEGRANINSLNFASIEPKQQFLTDFGTPYSKALKKNSESFFNSPLYHKTFRPNDNDIKFLTSSLNSSFYDFPFMLSQTSDLIRHAWIDWFAQ